MRTVPFFTVLVALLVPVGGVSARIKLVALPARAAVTIRLDNPAATLIEEERLLTLHQGVNQVDFAWKGVGIDEDSIRLEVLDHPGEVTLLNVTYPPGEAALVWELGAARDRQERVRISYLLGRIDRLITYKAVADADEKHVDLKSFLVLRNFSGEDFDKARVLLDYGRAFERSVRHEETARVLFFRAEEVPITKVWTFDTAQLPWDPEQVAGNVGIPTSYRIANTPAAGLGQVALAAGKVRIYQDDGHGGTIFLGEDRTDLVPVGEETELYIGDSRDIVVTQRKMRDQRTNVRRNRRDEIVLYDTDEIITARLENFKDTPAVLTLLEHIPGEWEMVECNLDYQKRDASTLAFEVELPPRAVRELTMHYRRHNVRGPLPAPRGRPRGRSRPRPDAQPRFRSQPDAPPRPRR